MRVMHCGLRAFTVRERELFNTASHTFRLKEVDLKRSLTDMGRAFVPLGLRTKNSPHSPRG